jgi:hypothetical protein
MTDCNKCVTLLAFGDTESDMCSSVLWATPHGYRFATRQEISVAPKFLSSAALAPACSSGPHSTLTLECRTRGKRTPVQLQPKEMPPIVRSGAFSLSLFRALAARP